MELPKAAELQSAAEIACRVLSYYPGLCQNNLKIHLSRNKSLTVAACYRPPSATSCALDIICELIAPNLSSDLILFGEPNLGHAKHPGRPTT
jgi:hypothetical protein